MKRYQFGLVLTLLLSSIWMTSATVNAQHQDRPRFFVFGAVHKPGQFEFKDGITIRRAMTLCEGSNENADLARAIIFREDQSTGKRKEISLDLAAVLTGRDRDVVLVENDVVFIPKIRKQ